MDDGGQRIDLVAVDQHIELDNVGRAELLELVVERGIAARYRFELVEEIHDDFGHRHFIDELYLPAVIGHIDLVAAFLVTQRHHVAQVFLRHKNGDGNYRLADFLNFRCLRQFGRIFDRHDRAIPHHDFIHDRRRRRNQILVELAFQTLLHNLHVQQAEKTAAEAEPQGLRNLRFVMQ